ncbi:MAG: hypothetical protein AAFO81_12620 [Pseudomonadota bacterium]
MPKFVAMLLTTMLLHSLLPAMANTESSLRDDIQSLLQTYQRETGVPVAGLSDETLDELTTGKLVYRQVTMTQANNSSDTTTIRVVGYHLIDKPREPLWLSALAFDAGFSSRLTEHFVSVNDASGACWYQHINMPWPLRDRHWLIQTSKNTALTRLTNNRIWEHRWQLRSNAQSLIEKLFARETVGDLDQETAAKSILLPMNDGAWTMATIGDGRTLVVVHATMDMGGIIPDRLVARQTRKQLIRMLTKIETDSDTAYERYNNAYLIYRGDGSLIAPRNTQGRLAR